MRRDSLELNEDRAIVVDVNKLVNASDLCAKSGVSSPLQQFQGSVEIDAPTPLAYALWSDCENFPQFMRGVQEVRRVDEHHLHWRAEMWGEVVQWDAEILEDIPNSQISWRTITGAAATGTVRFEALGPKRVRVLHEIQLQAEHDDRTEITARITEDLERFRVFVQSRRQN
jgi:uncharacterized membrane protein